jgi:predicted ATPase
LDLYRGPLLPGFYEDWISVEALRFDSLFGQGTKRLIDLCIAEEDFDRAVQRAQRIWKLDPSDEFAVELLMSVLGAAGRPKEAMRVYQRFCEDDLVDGAGGLSPKILTLAKTIERQVQSAPREPWADRLEMTSEEADSSSPGTADSGASGEGPYAPTDSGVHDRIRAESQSRLIGDEFLIRTFTRFFGRTEEIAQLAKMLMTPKTRLITISGPGGIGKTRFVLEVVAQAAEGNFGEMSSFSVLFLPLADASEPGQVFDRVLKVLGGTVQEGESAADAVLGAIAHCDHPVLILDNFEHLVGDGALLVRSLLLKSPHIRVVVTSRHRLRIDGEQVFTLSPLPAPDGTAPLSEAMKNPSVSLFVDRAQAVRQDFELTAGNIGAITRICTLLEGLPLAIELAAARVSIMPPARIMAEIELNRLDFLGARSNDRATRQQTLRSTLEWSTNLLAQDAKRLLAVLSIFRGGWTIEAAQEVYGDEPPVLLRLLTELRDCSLITVIDTEEGMRFTMLEVIREAAAEELAKLGPADYARRHANYFVKLAEGIVPGLLSPQGLDTLRRFSLEQANLAVAGAWADANPADFVNQPLGVALVRFWLSVRWDQIVRRLQKPIANRESTLGLLIPLGGPMEFVVDPDQVSGYLQELARLLEERGITEAAGWYLVQLGYTNLGRDLHFARKVAERGVALMRPNSNERYANDAALAHALNTLAVIVCLQGDYGRARELNREAFTRLRDDRASKTHDFTVHVEGLVAFMSGDHALGERCLKQNIEFARQSSDTRSEFASLYILIRIYNELGRFTESLDAYGQALRISSEARSGNTYLAGYLSCYVGYARFKLSQLPEAFQALRHSLVVFGDSKRIQGFAITLRVLAEIALVRQVYDLSAQLYGASEMLRERHGRALDYQEAIWDKTLRGALEEALGRQFQGEVARGRSLTEQQAVALGFQSIDRE